MAINLSPPTFASGALLSAYALNAMADCVNTIRGASIAPTGVFVKSGINQSWYLRRRYRYLHVAYSITFSGSDDLDVSIDFGTATNNYNHSVGVSYQWRTYDLNSVGGVAVGDFYAINVTRVGNDFSFQVEEIRESSNSSPSGTGTYSTPPTFAGTENAAAFLADLQALTATVTGMQDVVRYQPSDAVLRVTEPTSFRLRRRQTSLVVNVTVTGDTPELDLYINSTKTNNNVTTGTYTIDLSAVSGGPAVGDFYDFRFDRIAGYGIINYLYEHPNTPTVYAPQWAHGDAVDGQSAEYQKCTTALNSAQAILGNVGWQFAAIYRPYDGPEWSMRKTKRYLHYMRNGSLSAIIKDPSGEFSDTSLTRTTTDTPFASYDLDTLDWLAPGGLFYVDEADVVWMDDDA